MKSVPILIIVMLALAGCQREVSPPPTPSSSSAPDKVKMYAVRGVVLAISPDQRKASIKHEAVPGYMKAMTMEFTMRDTNVLKGIAAGDEISFALAVTPTDDWVENIQVLGKTNTFGVNGPPGWHVTEPGLAVGDKLPDYEFTDEYGRPVRFSDFAGSAVAFTFFYTACPLPEYCPRMNRYLQETRKILTDLNAPPNWQLLSISFDPGFDTPQVLSGYANFYRGTDTNHWLFAVASTNTLTGLAPNVDLSFWREQGSISHNLRTVVLAPDGKIAAQLDGNDWKPEELADAILKAAAQK